MNRREHAAHVNEAWRKSVDAVIETGLRLIDAREGLEPDEYLAMVTEDLNCSRSTAFKLVAIASNKILSNVSHAKRLPASPETLYLLTVAANKGLDLEAAIKRGAIHPKMERKGARALMPPPPQRDDDLEEPDKEDDQPHEDEPVVNPLVVAWESASPEARRDFVRVCWSEIIRAREDQVMAADRNGNGVDHWAQPSKGNGEDRWIESDSL